MGLFPDGAAGISGVCPISGYITAGLFFVPLLAVSKKIPTFMAQISAMPTPFEDYQNQIAANSPFGEDSIFSAKSRAAEEARWQERILARKQAEAAKKTAMEEDMGKREEMKVIAPLSSNYNRLLFLDPTFVGINPLNSPILEVIIPKNILNPFSNLFPTNILNQNFPTESNSYYCFININTPAPPQQQNATFLAAMNQLLTNGTAPIVNGQIDISNNRNAYFNNIAALLQNPVNQQNLFLVEVDNSGYSIIERLIRLSAKYFSRVPGAAQAANNLIGNFIGPAPRIVNPNALLPGQPPTIPNPNYPLLANSQTIAGNYFPPIYQVNPIAGGNPNIVRLDPAIASSVPGTPFTLPAGSDFFYSRQNGFADVVRVPANTIIEAACIAAQRPQFPPTLLNDPGYQLLETQGVFEISSIANQADFTPAEYQSNMFTTLANEHAIGNRLLNVNNFTRRMKGIYVQAFTGGSTFIYDIALNGNGATAAIRNNRPVFVIPNVVIGQLRTRFVAAWAPGNNVLDGNTLPRLIP